MNSSYFMTTGNTAASFETSGDNNQTTSNGSAAAAAAAEELRMAPSFLRRIVLRLIGMKSAADKMPPIPYAILTNGKMAALIFIGVYLSFVALWLPFWLLSFAITEWGIYLLAIFTVFFVGRSIIRLIAFPGASQKVTAEIETEFAKYSVRIITSSCDALMEVASILSSAFPGGDSNSDSQQRRRASDLYDLPVFWRRAKTYRDRVFAVYLEVLLYLYHDQASTPSSSHGPPDLTKYGNNRLSGDIGNLSGLTPEARNDGKGLLERLKKVMALTDELEQLARPVLEAGLGPSTPNPLPPEAGTKAKSLLEAITELRDYVSSLKPGTSSNDADEEEESEEDLTVDAVRRKFEEQSGSALGAVKSGLASILPMLDPPPHTSIFGFDVQRGCMLARYRGARQLWVRCPNGGMLDGKI